LRQFCFCATAKSVSRDRQTVERRAAPCDLPAGILPGVQYPHGTLFQALLRSGELRALRHANTVMLSLDLDQGRRGRYGKPFCYGRFSEHERRSCGAEPDEPVRGENPCVQST
jgi:hypothetical protein